MEARAGTPSSRSPREAGSRYLLTVVPPAHLPHDPPHPRVSSACTGYGPPAAFRRGVLLPLYGSLSSQTAAIARQYGLPSSGGIVLYLASSKGGAGFDLASGPRITDDAWHMLWSDLLQKGSSSAKPPSSFASPSIRSRTGTAARDRVRSDASESRPIRTRAEPYDGFSSDSGFSDPNPPAVPVGKRMRGESSESSIVSPSRAEPGRSPPFGGDLVVGAVEFDIDHRQARWYAPWLKSAHPRAESNDLGLQASPSPAALRPLRLPGPRPREAYINGHAKPSARDLAPAPAVREAAGADKLSPRRAAVDEASACDSFTDRSSSGSPAAEPFYVPLEGEPPPDHHSDPDPLADVFGEDSAAWSEDSPAEASRHQGPTDTLTDASDDADIRDVARLVLKRDLTASNLSSPIRLNLSDLQRPQRPPPAAGARGATPDPDPARTASADSARPVGTASGGGLTPAQVLEHRKSAVEMTETLDLLAQNLAVLSPRALKASSPHSEPSPINRRPHSPIDIRTLDAGQDPYRRSSELERNAPQTPVSLRADPAARPALMALSGRESPSSPLRPPPAESTAAVGNSTVSSICAGDEAKPTAPMGSAASQAPPRAGVELESEAIRPKVRALTPTKNAVFSFWRNQV